MDETKLLAEALREEARLAREEMQQMCTSYLERIDWLNAEAARIENEKGPTTSPLTLSVIGKDWINRAIRVQGVRSKDDN